MNINPITLSELAELWLAACAIIGAAFALLIILASRNEVEEFDLEDLLEEWELQDHLEEMAEEEELLLEEEQDAQDLIDLLELDEDEEVI